MSLPKRKPNRLSHFDYSSPGAYFLTICTQDKRPLLSRIVGGGAYDAPFVALTNAGQIVQKYIESGNNVAGITVDKYVIMPNHVHILLLVDENSSNISAARRSPSNAFIPHFVSTLKRFCHHEIGEKIFQRSYHDHVIRGEKDYTKIWEYIDSNPAKWDLD